MRRLSGDADDGDDSVVDDGQREIGEAGTQGAFGVICPTREKREIEE